MGFRYGKWATVWASKRWVNGQRFYIRRGVPPQEIVGPFATRKAAWLWQETEDAREWRRPTPLTWRNRNART
jgi:hypothetical protein